MIEFDLRQFLSTRTEVQAYVGSSPARVFPVKAPQKVAMPYQTFRRLSGGFTHTLQGGAQTTLGRFGVSSFAADYETAKELAFATRENMQGFGGELKHLHVYGITCDNEEDLYEDPTDASDTGAYHVFQEYGIKYYDTHKNTET